MSERITYVDPEKLIPNEHNTKLHDELQIADLARSIQQFGFVKPIISDEKLVILAGHGVHLAALRLNLAKVPVIKKTGLSAQQKRAYLVLDNRLAELSAWDKKKLVDELAILDGFEFEHIKPREFFDGSRALLPGLELATLNGTEPDRFMRYSSEQITEEACRWYREAGFPYRKITLHEAMQEINALAALEGQTLLTSSLGYEVADTFHPHRLHAHADGKRSPFESFHKDASLRKSIELQLDQGRVGTGYIGMMSLVKNTQACSNFRPAFAKYIYRMFGDEGCRVLDTSTGYGGRLVGFAAAFESAEYVGIDPHPKTHEGNLAMCAALGIAERVHLINAPAEDVPLEEIGGPVDLAFTSPPYFKKELYSDDETQCYVRYPEIEQWRDGFLIPMLRLQYDALRLGGINVLNVADVRIKNKLFALQEMTLECAQLVGFKHLETMKFKLPHRRYGEYSQDHREASEPVFVFEK